MTYAYNFLLVVVLSLLTSCSTDGHPDMHYYDYSLENQSQVPIKIKVYGQAKGEKNYCEEHEILPGEKAIYDKKNFVRGLRNLACYGYFRHGWKP